LGGSQGKEYGLGIGDKKGKSLMKEYECPMVIPNKLSTKMSPIKKGGENPTGVSHPGEPGETESD